MRSIPTLLLAGALALAGCDRGARETGPAPDPVPAAAPAAAPPIIWIVVDTLRPDRLEWYGAERATMPSLAPLVERGVLFERAYTTRPETSPAIASMLTGLHPSHHGVALMYYLLHDQNRTAAEILGEAGYDTAAFVSSFIMIEDFSALSQGFALYDDFVTERERTRENYERRAEHTLARATEWLDAHDGSPFFLFVHLIDPHGPYDPPPEYIPEPGPADDPTPVPEDHAPRYARIEGARTLGDYLRHYDGEIRYTDHHLGRFLDELDAKGLLDPALVIFTADHGESMGERGSYFVHGGDLHEENVRIPLIVKPPAGGSAGGRRVDRPVSVVDLLPTTLDVAGVALEGELDGASLAPWLAGAEGAERPVFLERRGDPVPEWGLVNGQRKTLFFEDPAGARFEQYDLAADPGERRDLVAAGEDADADRLRLAEWAASATAYRLGFEPVHNHMKEALRGDFVRERMTDAERADTERLRALGYVE